MIEIKNLHYSYGKITALRGINLAANSGEITAIIGANGAGKSTLMKCIAGLLKPNIGEILCDGERLPAEPHNVVKRNIVLVPEGRWIFPNLTVEENLKMGAYTVKDNTENMEKAYAMFNRLGERKRQLAGHRGRTVPLVFHAFRRGAANAGDCACTDVESENNSF